MKSPKKRIGGCCGEPLGSCSMTAKYQKKSCTSSGVLRNNSTYAIAKRLSSQFRESRPIPTSSPRIVASAMPRRATVIVLNRPAIIASAWESVGS